MPKDQTADFIFFSACIEEDTYIRGPDKSQNLKGGECLDKGIKLKIDGSLQLREFLQPLQDQPFAEKSAQQHVLCRIESIGHFQPQLYRSLHHLGVWNLLFLVEGRLNRNLKEIHIHSSLCEKNAFHQVGKVSHS